jgi:hypothetical protein
LYAIVSDIQRKAENNYSSGVNRDQIRVILKDETGSIPLILWN